MLGGGGAERLERLHVHRTLDEQVHPEPSEHLELGQFLGRRAPRQVRAQRDLQQRLRGQIADDARACAVGADQHGDGQAVEQAPKFGPLHLDDVSLVEDSGDNILEPIVDAMARHRFRQRLHVEPPASSVHRSEGQFTSRA